MTIGAARATLSMVWIVGAGPLIVIIAIQTIGGVYRDEWDLPWSWLALLLFPTMSLIVSVWTVAPARILGRPLTSRYILWGATALSLFYLAILYAVVVLGNQSPLDIAKLFRASTWFLVPLQAVVTLAVSKLFLENIE